MAENVEHDLSPELEPRVRSKCGKRSVALQAFLAIAFYLGTYTSRFTIYLLPWENRSGGVDNKVQCYSLSLDKASTLPKKVWISMAQVLGYALLKIPAVKYVSELKRKSRLSMLTTCYVLTSIFTTVPLPFVAPYVAAVFVFLGAASASTIWGITLQYLEGREYTDFLFAAMNMVVVFGASAVRGVGQTIVDIIGESHQLWMPMITTFLYFPIAIVALRALDKFDDPSEADVVARAPRRPMNSQERKKFCCSYSIALVPLILAYMMITSYRSYRDFFPREIYTDLLGRTPTSTDYIIADWPGGVFASIMLGFLVTIKSNRRAVILLNIAVLVGAGVLICGTFLFQKKVLPPLLWIAIATMGLMMCYTPTGSFLFDRLLGATRTPGTSVFLVYIADGLGYFSVVSLLLIKNFGTWLQADDYGGSFVRMTYGLAVAIVVLVLPGVIWLSAVLPKEQYAALRTMDDSIQMKILGDDPEEEDAYEESASDNIDDSSQV
eukprot:m.71408 g.71408  ORF g.71408 m.71408 type:complete len:494 (-) comp12242_c0_seq1:101-1582(-)